MTNPKEALEWYERKRVEARAMADRDCKSCKHNKPDGCSRWDCEYEPKMVEVVRCKDCKYWQDNNGGYPNQNCRWNEQETPDADDFCSFAERREP